MLREIKGRSVSQWARLLQDLLRGIVVKDGEKLRDTTRAPLDVTIRLINEDGLAELIVEALDAPAFSFDIEALLTESDFDPEVAEEVLRSRLALPPKYRDDN